MFGVWGLGFGVWGLGFGVWGRRLGGCRRLLEGAEGDGFDAEGRDLHCAFDSLRGLVDSQGQDYAELCCPTRRVLEDMTEEEHRERHLTCARRLAIHNRDQLETKKRRALAEYRENPLLTSRRKLGGDGDAPGQICPSWCSVCDCIYDLCFLK